MKEQLQRFTADDSDLLENECKICYLEFDEDRHHPMLICVAQHVVCRDCFRSMTKLKSIMECPFCKRNTPTQDVLVFKYALMAGQKYAQLKHKYLELLDHLDGLRNSATSSRVSSRPQRNRKEESSPLAAETSTQSKQSLAQLSRTIAALKTRVKLSENSNLDLTHQIQIERQKYTAFELGINECRYNELIMKNKFTMLEYDSKQLEKDRIRLQQECTALRNEITMSKSMLRVALERNELLKRENQSLKQSKELQVIEEIKIESPQAHDEVMRDESLLFFTPKKSKSVSLIKEELKEEFMPQRSEKRKIKISKAAIEQRKGKDDALRNFEKRSDKFLKKNVKL